MKYAVFERLRCCGVTAAHNQQEAEEESATPSNSSAGFGIRVEQLVEITRDNPLGVLNQYQGVGGLSDLLDTDLRRGIRGDDDDILSRKNAFGTNTYPRKKGKSFWMFLWEVRQDFILALLMLIAITSLLLRMVIEGIEDGWYIAAGIVFPVLIVIVVTAISDYKLSLQFEKLNEVERNKIIEVIREGKGVKVSFCDIVVGDVIPLKIGDQVPADGLLLYGCSLQITECSFMGERTQRSHVRKDPVTDPIVIYGSEVEEGIGAMLVTSVGINTQWGRVLADIPVETGEESPLQVYLNVIANAIGLISVSLAVVVLLTQLLLYFTGHTKNSDGTPIFIPGMTKANEIVYDVIKIIILGVSNVVVAVPSGLSLAVTLNLAYTMRRMMADKALVKTPSACEKMGSVSAIVYDGILTSNQMEVVDACIGVERMRCWSEIPLLAPHLTSLITEGIAQNTNGSVFLPEGQSEVRESPIERAILDWGIKLGMDKYQVRSKSSILHVSPFNSKKRWRGVALRMNDSLVHVHWKGAAETILSSCAWYMDMDHVEPMEEQQVKYFRGVIENMSRQGFRCAAFAYQTCRMEDFRSNGGSSKLLENGLVLLAIIGIEDCCQLDVKAAVRLCHTAHVKVCMVTGDDSRTAEAIASKYGVLTASSEHVIIEGDKFRSLSDEEREELAEKSVVIARASPGDSLLLLEALQRKGHEVAATGKCINDARTLLQANIGLAMGMQGTAVANASSDIVILDDNFATIVKVIRWSRSFYTNTQKFTQFRLTVSAAASIICVIVVIRSGAFPLNIMQLLWVNLLIDTLGALALAFESPNERLMHRPPVGAREPFITKLMWAKFLVQVLYQVSALLFLNFHGESILQLKNDNLNHANKIKNTLIFNSFVFCQVFNEFDCRNLDRKNVFIGILRDHLFLGIVVLTVILQIIVIEFLGIFISTVRLDWKQWLISIGIGFFSQIANRFPFQAFPYLRD